MYSGPSETSKMDPFAKIVDCIQPLTFFENHIILFVSQGYEYDSDKTKQNPGLGLQSLQFFFKFNFIFTLLPCCNP